MLTPLVLLSLLTYFVITALPSMYITAKLLDRWTTKNPMTLKVALTIAVAFINIMGIPVLMTYLVKHPLVVQ